MKKSLFALFASAAFMSAAPAFAGGSVLDDAGKLSLSAKTYIDGSIHETTANGVKTKSSAGFNVKRFYTTLKYKADGVWSGRITTDVNNEAKVAGQKRNMQVYLKYAYIQGSFSDAANVRFGVAPTSWIGYEEHLWGHRYVTNVFVDGYKFDDSADYGINFYGKAADGMLEYSVSEINGGGYSNPAPTKGLDFNGRLTIKPIEGLHISGQFRDGYRGTKTFAAGVTAAGTKSSLMQGLVSYGMGHDFRVAIGYVNNKKKTGAVTVKDTGGDVWAWYNFSPAFGVFARYDQKDHTDTAVAGVKGKTTRFLGGFDYHANKHLSISLIADNSKFTDASSSSTVAKGNTGKSTTYGLYSQFKF